VIVVLAFEGVQLLDVAGPVQTFATANEIVQEARRRPVRGVMLARRLAGSIRTTSGLPLLTRRLAGATDTARIDTLIIPRRARGS
jgi:transcriptional regulator GlxA family with amidase domain